MKKKRFKLIAGMLALSTNLLLTGCGAKEVEGNISVEENIEAESETIAKSITNASNDISTAVSDTLSTTMESLDEFSEERKIFEDLVSNSEIIYTDEFRSLKNIYITWNRASNYYEMTAEYGEAKYEINLENADLINFLLHQTNCCKVVIEHDKDSTLLSSLTACDTIKSITLNDCNITSIESLSCLSNLEEITINH
ncbi:MAG: hypothetical protein K2G03_05530, partial [Bacilli bacterium]|nr:hypothetical protein [Bacilli bacterium]